MSHGCTFLSVPIQIMECSEPNLFCNTHWMHAIHFQTQTDGFMVWITNLTMVDIKCWQMSGLCRIVWFSLHLKQKTSDEEAIQLYKHYYA